MRKLQQCFLVIILSSLPMGFLQAEEVLAEGKKEASVSAENHDGKWHFGGAARVRYDYLYSPQPENSYIGIDTMRIDVDYNSSTWFGAAQYRFYGHFYPYHYEDTFGQINFPAFAWLGYKFTPEHTVVAGLNLIPFGLPVESSAFYQTLTNLAGLEDINNLGIKYQFKRNNIAVDLGYYPRDGGNWLGTSRDSARYNANIVKADDYLGSRGTNNKERNQFIGRFGYTLKHTEEMRSEFGVSGLYSTLKNDDTDENGKRRAFALHYVGQYKAFGIAAQFTRQVMSPRNPSATGNDHVTFGSFDGSFNVAAKANIYTLELNYALPWATSWIKDIKPYVNYSYVDKDKSDFKKSQRAIVGTQFANGPIFTYLEMRWGRNDTLTGDFEDGMAAGGTNEWKKSIHANIGYYF